MYTWKPTNFESLHLSLGAGMEHGRTFSTAMIAYAQNTSHQIGNINSGIRARSEYWLGHSRQNQASSMFRYVVASHEKYHPHPKALTATMAAGQMAVAFANVLSIEASKSDIVERILGPTATFQERATERASATRTAEKRFRSLTGFATYQDLDGVRSLFRSTLEEAVQLITDAHLVGEAVNEYCAVQGMPQFEPLPLPSETKL